MAVQTPAMEVGCSLLVGVKERGFYDAHALNLTISVLVPTLTHLCMHSRATLACVCVRVCVCAKRQTKSTKPL